MNGGGQFCKTSEHDLLVLLHWLNNKKTVIEMLVSHRLATLFGAKCHIIISFDRQLCICIQHHLQLEDAALRRASAKPVRA